MKKSYENYTFLIDKKEKSDLILDHYNTSEKLFEKEEFTSSLINVNQKSKIPERVLDIYNAISKQDKPEQPLIKIWFLKAILTKNINLFNEVLLRIKFNKNELDTDLFCFDNKPESILNHSILGYLQEMLNNEESKALLSILMRTFQSIPEFTQDKNSIGLGMKSKKKIFFSLLEGIEKEKAKSIDSQLKDLSFDSVLVSFRPSLGDKNYIKTKIKKENYLASIIDGRADISEFIVLTIGFLQSLDNMDQKIIHKLSANYLFVDYESCLKDINNYFESNIIKDKSYKLVIQSMNKLKDLDVHENHTRRFFETRLALYINGLTHSVDSLMDINLNSLDEANDEELKEKTLNSVNKITSFFLQKEGRVNSPREMEEKISILANSYKDESRFSKEEINFINDLRDKKCTVYKSRDRVEKNSRVVERKFETTPEKVGEDVWNISGGVMKATSPTFFFNLNEQPPMRNMLVDSSKVEDKKEEKKQWFWTNNRFRSAYVGSISGHTCNVVGILNKYIEANKKDINCSEDITLFLVQLVATYAKRGYHAMLEVMDVIHDDEVQKVFSENGIKIDLREYFTNNNESYDFFSYAMNDSASYAIRMINQSRIEKEIKNKFPEHKAIENSNNINTDNNENSNKYLTIN